MDTEARSDAFEDVMFNLIKKELLNNRLGLFRSQAKIFKKKGYFSKDRKSYIIVDIAIEVWPPEAENYSILWVCECKNYSGLVPVNDVEAFKAKLDQIAGKNIKGVLASRNALQPGALDYAQSNGIGSSGSCPTTRWIGLDTPRVRLCLGKTGTGNLLAASQGKTIGVKTVPSMQSMVLIFFIT